MNYLIIGQNGQLGKKLIEHFSEKTTKLSISASQLANYEIDEIMTQIDKISPSAIINAAAWTDVDTAEKNENLVRILNSVLPTKLACVSKKLEIPFYHISTDYVFSGKRSTPWEIDDKKSPLGVYARTKSLGEDMSIDTYPNGVRIFRTSWLYSNYGKNFAKTMTKFALRDKNNVRVVDDHLGQPTSAADLAKQILLSLKNGINPGIYHATNSGEATWNDFAKEIFCLIGEDVNRVLPIHGTELSRPAPRPSYSVLSHTCWENTEVKAMRNWREALADQITEIKAAVVSERI